MTERGRGARQPPRPSAAPIVAVGVQLLAILVVLCVYSLRSGETSTQAMKNGWPFATGLELRWDR